MKIDITESTAAEIIEILEMYPYGRLQINNERVIWDSGVTSPRPNNRSPHYEGNSRLAGAGSGSRQNSLEKAGRVINSMGNSLMSIVGPPKIRRREENGR